MSEQTRDIDVEVEVIRKKVRLKVKGETRFATFYADDPTLTQHAITKAIKTINLGDNDIRLVISKALDLIAKEYEKNTPEVVIDNPEPKIYEVVIEDGKPTFAVYDGNEVKFRTIIKGEKAERNPLWLPYPRPIDYETDQALYNEVKAFFKKYLWLSDKRYYDVLASFVLATYRQGDFDVATYLFFFGPHKTGKSRALELLQLLCYRGIKCENTKLAGIYYLSDKFKPTHLYDETQKYNRREYAEIIEILDSGQRRPGVVVRLEKDENGNFKPRPYEVFGFKVLAGRDPFHLSLTSRCIVFHMRKAPHRMPKLRYSKAVEEVKELRAKLIMYRFKSLGIPLPSIDDSAFMDDRNAEVFEPLLAVAPESVRLTLLELGKEIEKEESEEERSNWEARVLNAFLNVRKRLLEQAVKDEKVEVNKIAVIDVAKELDENNPKSLATNVGKVLSRLGFKPTRVGHKAIRAYKWDDKLIQELATRYLEKNDLPSYIRNSASASVSTSSQDVKDAKLVNQAKKDYEIINADVADTKNQKEGRCQKCGSELKGGYYKRDDGSIWCLDCMEKEEQRLAILCELINTPMTDEEIIKVFEHQSDFDPKKIRYFIDQARRSEYKPFTRENLMEVLKA
ncbi:MAG: hypothetical protein QXD42_05065 [Nitrososphaerales archaeon]